MIWYRDWLFVGHDCEVPNPGDYLTVQIGEYPVVVVRDRNGGCMPSTMPAGIAARESAPPSAARSRAWCARIINGPIISTAACSRRATWAPDSTARNTGCIACTARASAATSGCASPRWRRISSRSAGTSSLTFCRTTCIRPRSPSRPPSSSEANWKLVWENNRECYHCSANHPELIRTFPETPTVTGVAGAESNPEHHRQVGALGIDRIAEPISHLSENGQYRTIAHAAGRRRGELHHGRQGRRCAGPLIDTIAEPDLGTLLLFHYPTIWNHVLADHAISFRLLPVSPTRDPAHHQVAGAQGRGRGRRLRCRSA